MPKANQTTQKGELWTNLPEIFDAKILNRILAKRIQQCPKRIIHHNQMGFISGMQR